MVCYFYNNNNNNNNNNASFQAALPLAPRALLHFTVTEKKNKRLLAVQPCTYFSLIWLKFTFVEFQWSGKGMTLEKKYKKVASWQILLSNKDTPPSIPARDFNYNTYTRTNLWSTRPKSEFNLSFLWEYFLRQKKNWKKNNLSLSNHSPHYSPNILILRIKESNEEKNYTSKLLFTSLTP